MVGPLHSPSPTPPPHDASRGEAQSTARPEPQHRLTGLARPVGAPVASSAPDTDSTPPPERVEALPSTLDSAPTAPVDSYVPSSRHEPPSLPLQFPELLQSTSVDALQLTIRGLCEWTRQVDNIEDLKIRSGKAVAASYNAQEPALRAQLWSDWQIYSTLARALGVPVFPLFPAAVGLVLAACADLPVSPVLRGLAHYDRPFDPAAIPHVLETLGLAGRAIRNIWPGASIFQGDAHTHRETFDLNAHGERHAALAWDIHQRQFASSSSDPPPTPPAAGHLQPAYPPSSESFTSRPLLTHVPPAAPAPAFVTPPPDQFIQPAHGDNDQTDTSLRSLCEGLPTVLNDLQKATDDLATFELAQERFQSTVNTPDYASRVARLHHTAVIYTHITALLRFPTYPITPRKLAVFALAMTPGPLGVFLDDAAPELQRGRQCPRATKGKTLEDILRDLTLVREITLGGDVALEDNAEWARWWKEVTDDWKGKGKGKSKMRRGRPPGPAAKRIKRSASPDSDASAASTSRLLPATGAKRPPGRPLRSRMSLTEPPSRGSSPAVRPGRGAGGRPPGQKKGYVYAPTGRPLTSFPRFVPDRKGVLPPKRNVPPLPPIMDSPWFVPRKQRKPPPVAAAAGVRGMSGTGGAGDGPESVRGEEDGMGAEDYGEEGDDDEEDGGSASAKQVRGRSVALHRPRRGGLDMKAFDISLLWD